MRFQDHRQRGHKVYALHAPEVECIGKGKAKAPHEFGCKVSTTTPSTKPKDGQFLLHAEALDGNPFDGHLGPVIADLASQNRVTPCRIYATRAIAATTTRTSSGCGSPARRAARPVRSPAR